MKSQQVVLHDLLEKRYSLRPYGWPDGEVADKESRKFIERFNTLKKDLLDLADQFHDLEHFYDRQKPTWENLRKAYSAFQLNRLELEKDDQAGPAPKRMQEILTARMPCALIKEADALINTINAVNSPLLVGRRTQAIARIDARITTLNRDLAEAQGEASLRAARIKRLEAMREQVQKGQSLAHSTQAEGEAVKEFDAAVGSIEEFLRKLAEQMKPKDDGSGTVQPPLPVVKKQRSLNRQSS
jgi:predicted  nucleic acid-binding Zn-ribbon protein